MVMQSIRRLVRRILKTSRWKDLTSSCCMYSYNTIRDKLTLPLSARSMAQKESYHREVVDDLNIQLSQTRRHLDELTTLSRDQVISSIYLHFSYAYTLV